MPDLRIAPITRDHLKALAGLLSETVAAGGSVSFLHPLAQERAEAFWQDALVDMECGGRIILGAFDGQTLAATVSLVWATQENQQHRAEVAKLMTAVGYRGRGAARCLMQAAEKLARENGKSLIILDTAEQDGASGLYEKLGYTRAGMIPDFALKPDGGLSATVLFWKRV